MCHFNIYFFFSFCFFYSVLWVIWSCLYNSVLFIYDFFLLYVYMLSILFSDCSTNTYFSVYLESIFYRFQCSAKPCHHIVPFTLNNTCDTYILPLHTLAIVANNAIFICFQSPNWFGRTQWKSDVLYFPQIVTLLAAFLSPVVPTSCGVISPEWEPTLAILTEWSSLKEFRYSFFIKNAFLS